MSGSSTRGVATDAHAWARLRRFGVALLLASCAAFVFYWNMPLLEVWHVPDAYARRAGAFSANVAGGMALAGVRRASYRLNGGRASPVGREGPRASRSTFSVELLPGELRPGRNVLEIRAEGWLRPPHVIERTFRYDPAPVVLPLTNRWTDLDVQDGRWEVVEGSGERRVRPKPGTEGYDRMLAVTGSFGGDRRVETDVVFRRHTLGLFHRGAREYGFGVLPLWGGHADAGMHRPRRGWHFGLSWYWSKPGGIGNELSRRDGDGVPAWVNGYRDFAIEPGGHYQIVVETRRMLDAEGAPFFAQRTKWWRRGDPEPSEWLSLEARVQPRLPDGEYAVALLAFNCQVEFGAVRVRELPDPSAPSEGVALGGSERR